MSKSSAKRRGRRMSREQRYMYERNSEVVKRRDSQCALCGGFVESNIKFPDPMSASIDHILPVSKGGHPCDIDNLQLAHLGCNMNKSDKIHVANKETVLSERAVPEHVELV